MAEALPLTDYVSASSTSNTTFNTLKVQFGNGYEQRTPDGINNKVNKWNITYNNLTVAQRTTLWTFLDTVKATAWFTWTPPGGTSTKYVVDSDVGERALSGNLYSVSFSIKQVFDLV